MAGTVSPAGFVSRTRAASVSRQLMYGRALCVVRTCTVMIGVRHVRADAQTRAMGRFFGSASLVFLSACRSACSCGRRAGSRCTCFGATAADITSMADAVRAAGVTHVVATARDLIEEVALKVEETFYGVLFLGGTVAAAFNEAASVLPLKGEHEPSGMYLLPQDSSVHNVRWRSCCCCGVVCGAHSCCRYVRRCLCLGSHRGVLAAPS